MRAADSAPGAQARALNLGMEYDARMAGRVSDQPRARFPNPKALGATLHLRHLPAPLPSARAITILIPTQFSPQ